MRKLALGMLFVASSFALSMGCSASGGDKSGGAGQEEEDAGNPVKHSSSNAGTTPPPVDNPPVDAGTAAPVDAARPPVVPDAAPPPPPPPPPPVLCTQLSACCAKLDFIKGLSCVAAGVAHNELACGAALVTFGCGTAGQTIGPKCSQLKSCCESNQYIVDDPQCKNDYKAGNESLCDSDLYYYQTDPYQDCL